MGGARPKTGYMPGGKKQNFEIGAIIYQDSDTGTPYGFTDKEHKHRVELTDPESMKKVFNYGYGGTVLLKGKPGHTQSYVFAKTMGRQKIGCYSHSTIQGIIYEF